MIAKQTLTAYLSKPSKQAPNRKGAGLFPKNNMRSSLIDFYKNMRLALCNFQEDSEARLEKYAKLLAWVYAYGGGCEAVTQDLRMVADIAVAQKIFNVSGGERPQHTEILQKYLQEVKFALSRKEYPKDTEHPAWAYEICENYNLKLLLLKYL